MSDEFAHLRDVRLQDLGQRRLTWYSVEPLGHYSSLGLVSSGPVAIIAGFVLSGAVGVATLDPLETLDAVSVLAFSLSALILFAVLMLIVEANASFSTPADRLSWFPEAEISEGVLNDLRHRQREDFARYFARRQRILSIYPVGLALALFALAAVIGARAQLDGAKTSDWLLASGSVILIVAAIYVCSFSSSFGRLDDWRYERALKRGTKLLEWKSTTPDTAKLGRHVVVTDLPLEGPDVT